MKIHFGDVTPYFTQEEIYASSGFYRDSSDQKRISGAILSLAKQVSSPNFGLKPIGASADFGIRREGGKALSASLLNTMVLQLE